VVEQLVKLRFPKLQAYFVVNLIMDARNLAVNATSLENKAAMEKFFNDNVNKVVDWAISKSESGEPVGNPSEIIREIMAMPDSPPPPTT
jgi:hypothetical protein